MNEELLIKIADQTERWLHAGRWQEGPRAGELYIEDEDGRSRVDDLAKLVALIAEECAVLADMAEEGPSAGPEIRARFCS